jgi:hypothetical protein
MFTKFQATAELPKPFLQNTGGFTTSKLPADLQPPKYRRIYNLQNTGGFTTSKLPADLPPRFLTL